jgi:mono/diheme cytochrome c family protein
MSFFHSVTVISLAFTAALFAAGSPAHAAPPSQELVQRGAYCARAGDCIGCHTAPGGQPYAGGAPFSLSVGKVYSTNITADLETGIGRYSLDDFVKVMRQGVAKDGHRLYPAMPYPSYVKVSQEDLTALYAFFMQGVTPVHNPNHPAKLNWLLGVRSYMAVWNALYFKKGDYAANPEKNVSWNRGAYLVQGLGHCGDCHTPRGIAGQVKAGSEKDGRLFLAGATLENWHASSLTGDYGTGLHAWLNDEIVDYLKTGRTARVAATGMMAGVVGKSTQYLTDTDLTAIADYLKSLPPSNDKGHNNADSAMQANAAAATTAALRTGDTGMRGSRLYLDNCNSCHGSDGSGAKRTFPNLVKNEAVDASDPVSLIHIVLSGASMPQTLTAPSALAMPGFGWRLTDAEVADVLSFIRGGWGNHAAAVGRREVGRVRKALVTQTVQKQKSGDE